MRQKSGREFCRGGVFESSLGCVDMFVDVGTKACDVAMNLKVESYFMAVGVVGTQCGIKNIRLLGEQGKVRLLGLGL